MTLRVRASFTESREQTLFLYMKIQETAPLIKLKMANNNNAISKASGTITPKSLSQAPKSVYRVKNTKPILRYGISVGNTIYRYFLI